MKSLEADVVFNYKKKDTKKALKELGDGMNIYWDNVSLSPARNFLNLKLLPFHL